MMAKESLHPKRMDSTISSGFGAFAPRSNLLYGLEGKLIFFRDRIVLEGEWMKSLLESSVGGIYIPGLDTVSWQEPLLNQPQIRGQAWSIQAQATLSPTTRFFGRMMTIEPGYYSMAAPFLITDRKRYELRTDQSLWKGKFTLSVFAKRDFDNLLPYKITRTTVTSAGVNLRIRAKKLPYLQLSFAPLYRENTRTDSLRISDQISVLSVNSGYTFQVGGISSITSLVYSQQISRSLSGKTDFRAYIANLSQVISFSAPFSLNLSGSYVHSAWSQDFSETWTADVSGSATLFQKWTSTFGGMLVREEGESHRRGVYLSSTYPITKKMQVEVLMQQFWFDPYLEGRGQKHEWVYRGGVSYRW